MTSLNIYEDDYLLDDTSASGFKTVSKLLPHAITVGSTLVIDGRPQLKELPKILCPRCGQELQRGKTTMSFKYAPAQQSEQSVDALVCDCGEAYVPGDVARTAYHRAMRTMDVIAAQGLSLTEFANELQTLSVPQLHALWKMQSVAPNQQNPAEVQKREAIRQEAARRRAELDLTEWFVDEIIADSCISAKSQ